jgi:hypothetical protein
MDARVSAWHRRSKHSAHMGLASDCVDSSRMRGSLSKSGTPARMRFRTLRSAWRKSERRSFFCDKPKWDKILDLAFYQFGVCIVWKTSNTEEPQNASGAGRQPKQYVYYDLSRGWRMADFGSHQFVQ